MKRLTPCLKSGACAAYLVKVYLAEVKGPVLDRLRGNRLYHQVGDRIFLSTHQAVEALSH